MLVFFLLFCQKMEKGFELVEIGGVSSVDQEEPIADFEQLSDEKTSSSFEIVDENVSLDKENEVAPISTSWKDSLNPVLYFHALAKVYTAPFLVLLFMTQFLLKVTNSSRKEKKTDFDIESGICLYSHNERNASYHVGFECSR
jgi:hypothetical protein